MKLAVDAQFGKHVQAIRIDLRYRVDLPIEPDRVEFTLTLPGNVVSRAIR